MEPDVARRAPPRARPDGPNVAAGRRTVHSFAVFARRQEQR
jgi:hypothetical protein